MSYTKLIGLWVPTPHLCLSESISNFKSRIMYSNPFCLQYMQVSTFKVKGNFFSADGLYMHWFEFHNVWQCRAARVINFAWVNRYQMHLKSIICAFKIMITIGREHLSCPVVWPSYLPVTIYIKWFLLNDRWHQTIISMCLCAS